MLRRKDFKKPPKFDFLDSTQSIQAYSGLSACVCVGGGEITRDSAQGTMHGRDGAWIFSTSSIDFSLLNYLSHSIFGSSVSSRDKEMSGPGKGTN